jgi:16S rRNA G527 N7-methylase RsmG
MDTARIATLLEPFLLYPLSPAQLSGISTYIDLLLRWNTRTNLTAIRNPDDIVTRHFGESLFAAQILFPATTHAGTIVATAEGNLLPASTHARADTAADDSDLSRAEAATASPADSSSAAGTHLATQQAPGPAGAADDSPALQRRESVLQTAPPIGAPETSQHPTAAIDLLDIGSGAGFPGIPIHLWVPHLHTTLIESQQKKVAFLREIIRALTLTDINVSPARAEDFSSTARLVTLRAVERFDQILPTAAHLVAAHSRLALLIAAPQETTARRTLPGFIWQPPIAVPRASSRILLIGTSS